MQRLSPWEERRRPFSAKRNKTLAWFLKTTRLSAIKINQDLSKTFGENDFLYRMGNRTKVVETDKRRFSRTTNNKNFG